MLSLTEASAYSVLARACRAAGIRRTRIGVSKLRADLPVMTAPATPRTDGIVDGRWFPRGSGTLKSEPRRPQCAQGKDEGGRGLCGGPGEIAAPFSGRRLAAREAGSGPSAARRRALRPPPSAHADPERHRRRRRKHVRPQEAHQTLVDAGAFAGATKFVGCSFQFGDPAARTRRSGRRPSSTPATRTASPTTYNLQVQKPDDVRVVLNSARSGPTATEWTGGLDNTLDPDSNPATAGDPCSSKTLDVKATDDDVPLLFGSCRSSPTRRARHGSRSSRSRSRAGCCRGRCPTSSLRRSPPSSWTKTPAT